MDRWRWRYLVSIFAMAAAIGLLVHAFALRRLGWHRGATSPYVVLAAALVVASRRLARRDPTTSRPGAVAMLASGVLGLVSAMTPAFVIDPPLGYRSLARHHLRGFTVALPSGAEHDDSQSYAAGTFGVEINRDAMVLVGWIFGDGSRQELESMGASAKVSTPAVFGESRIESIEGRETFVIDLNRGDTLYLTTVACDGRVVFVQSLGVPERLHTRIVRSVRCTPEPHAPEPLPIELDARSLPLATQKDGTLVFTDGQALLAAGSIPAIAGSGVILSRAPAMLETRGVGEIRIESRNSDSVTYTGTVHGIAGKGVVRVVRCGRRAVMVLSFAGDDDRAADLDAAVAAARCKPTSP